MSTQSVAGAQLADLGPRFISGAIDGVILYVIKVVIALILGISGSNLANLISLVIALGYFVYFWSMQGGQTIGKKAMGIKVVKADGSPITPTTAILRYIGYFINTIVIFIGWIWILIDSQHQGFHDKIAGTLVVKA